MNYSSQSHMYLKPVSQFYPIQSPNYYSLGEDELKFTETKSQKLTSLSPFGYSRFKTNLSEFKTSYGGDIENLINKTSLPIHQRTYSKEIFQPFNDYASNITQKQIVLSSQMNEDIKKKMEDYYYMDLMDILTQFVNRKVQNPNDPNQVSQELLKISEFIDQLRKSLLLTDQTINLESSPQINNQGFISEQQSQIQQHRKRLQTEPSEVQPESRNYHNFLSEAQSQNSVNQSRVINENSNSWQRQPPLLLEQIPKQQNINIPTTKITEEQSEKIQDNEKNDNEHNHQIENQNDLALEIRNIIETQKILAQKNFEKEFGEFNLFKK